MISPINKHQKHAALARPSAGEWGRNELAILGTDCGSIKQLAYAVIQRLSSYKIAYADADHNNRETDGQSMSAISSGAYAEYTNKISFARFDVNAQPNAFQKRALFTDCDLILVNGNHFTASKQIVVIDDKKSLEKKLDRLTDVKMILLKDSSVQIPDCVSNHLPGIQSIPVLSFSDTEAIVEFIKQSLQKAIPAINGLVLTGGKSIRMGRDKGAIQYHDKSQRQYVYDLLAGFCNETFVSCNHEQAASVSQLFPVIEDTFLQLGPLGGILSAFQRNPNAAWLTVACDLPFLQKTTIEELINQRNPSKMATAFLNAEETFPEPLITIWEPKAYPQLLQFLGQGYSCPRKALINSDVQLLQAQNSFAFTNINTEKEYQEALQILNSGQIQK